MLTENEFNEAYKIQYAVEGIQRVIKSIDHLLGSDELHDLEYFIEQISETIKEK